MPIYEYECQRHGVFEVLKSISDYGSPEHCPTCEQPGSRILSSPNFALVSATERIARDRNERASHEPRRGNKADAQGRGHEHHGHGHHGHQHRKGQVKPGSLQAYTGKRPWVIEHG